MVFISSSSVFCSTSFTIASIFIIASIYMTSRINKSTVSNAFLSTLSKEQQEKYEKITNERKSIYYKGFFYSFLLAILLLILKSLLLSNKIITSNMITSILKNKYQSGSFIAGTTLLTTYFYYILAPKTDYMVLHLESKKQKEEWLNVYKTMQYTYHSGLALGIVAMFFFGMVYC